MTTCSNLPKLTLDLHLSALGALNDGHPREGQQGHADEGAGTDQHREHEQDARQDGIIQVEETDVVLQPGHEEGGILLEVEGLVLSDAEEDRRAAQVFAPELNFRRGRRQHVLGPLGEVGVDFGNGVGRPRRVPLFGHRPHQTAEGRRRGRGRD